MPHWFGKYEVLEELGSGGMAVVYKARDTMLQRTVALKVIGHKLRGGEVAHRRFLNEGRAAAALSHPNIVGVYELGVEGELPFIAMEYLSGRDLSDFVEQREPLELRHKLDIALQIGRALEHAHSRGIIHRDVKPGNIRLLEDGTVKLMDFGIAKITSEDPARLTKTGGMLGTVAYMAPEQLLGDTPPSAATDVFAFGIVLYELLTFRRPFDGPHSPAVMHRVLHAEAAPIDDADVPQALKDLVSDCLRKKLEERPLSFGSIIGRLLEIQHALPPGDGPEAGMAEASVRPTAPLRAAAGRSAIAARSAPEPSQETTAPGLGPAPERKPRSRARAAVLSVSGLVLLLGGAAALSLRQGWFVAQRPEPRPAGIQATALPTAAPAAPSPPTPAGHLTALPAARAAALLSSPLPAPSAGLPPTAVPTPSPAASLRITPSPSRTRRRMPVDPLSVSTEPPPFVSTPTLVPPPVGTSTPVLRPRAPLVAGPRVRELRLGGAPDGTLICLDGQRWLATRAGVAWILRDLEPGPHALRLVHTRKGAAEASLDLQASDDVQRFLLGEQDWKVPSFRTALKGAAGEAVPFEGRTDQPYKVEAAPGRPVTLSFQWLDEPPDEGELRIEASGGEESTRRCVRLASQLGCASLPTMECGAVN